MMFFAPSTAHGRGTVSSPASAAATELILLRRSYSCAQRPSPLELPPRPSSRWCQQHLEEGRDEDDQLSASVGCSATPTELRRSRCCDGAAQTSSVALILRVASRTRRAE